MTNLFECVCLPADPVIPVGRGPGEGLPLPVLFLAGGSWGPLGVRQWRMHKWVMMGASCRILPSAGVIEPNTYRRMIDLKKDTLTEKKKKKENAG